VASLPIPPAYEQPLPALLHRVLQPMHAATAPVCPPLLAATLQPHSWLPSREALCMLCWVDGPMRRIGFIGSGEYLGPWLRWLSSAVIAALFWHKLRVSYVKLQCFAGEPPGRGAREHVAHGMWAGLCRCVSSNCR